MLTYYKSTLDFNYFDFSSKFNFSFLVYSNRVSSDSFLVYSAWFLLSRISNCIYNLLFSFCNFPASYLFVLTSSCQSLTLFSIYSIIYWLFCISCSHIVLCSWKILIYSLCSVIIYEFSATFYLSSFSSCSNNLI